ncbi:UNVERIFIED_CONTAM: hypothetical protein FKN15_041574 [Acipenser sinensis]
MKDLDTVDPNSCKVHEGLGYCVPALQLKYREAMLYQLLKPCSFQTAIFSATKPHNFRSVPFQGQHTPAITFLKGIANTVW